MEMPGGWRMSMAWMRMPGQSWPGAAATFIGMWSVMMVAMMLPVLVPMLSRAQLGRRTTLAAAGYFAVWITCGVAVFPVGLAFAEIAMRMPLVSRAVPIATGMVVLVAGILQFTAWKTRQLACCRAAPMRALTANARTAWRHGLRLGLHCLRCCAGLTAVLLVVGVMDLRAMVLVAVAITAERLAPAGERVARALGAVIIGCGVYLIATGYPTTQPPDTLPTTATATASIIGLNTSSPLAFAFA
jgi:predicted metal-binding membrane protein